MFSGQGSQYYQMGRGLFEGQASFRRKVLRMDGVVRRLIGTSVVEVLYGSTPSTPFDRTLLTSPAILMVELALAELLIERGMNPDYVCGASFGTLAAATVAGCMAPDQALVLAIEQARAIEAHCQPGGMITLLGGRELYEGDSILLEHSEVAAVNSPSHVVIAGTVGGLNVIEAHLKRKGILFHRLPVRYAFHSKWIEDARLPLLACVRSISLTDPKVPILCCVTAETVPIISKEYFWTVMRSPIRFSETIMRCESRGPHTYIDVGPSGSMAAILRHALPSTPLSRVKWIMSPYADEVQQFGLVMGMSWGDGGGARQR